ncbi:tetratricopeptide repeat protein [Streptomyces sp. HUAS 31]|uniref:tetratricopeptide repeat protein n=1 Tax=Streptomyces sp. HUAS 31 TaxID=3020055 RepID=UPI003FA691F4
MQTRRFVEPHADSARTTSAPDRAGNSGESGAYESAGDLERAIPLYEATLAQREQVLGYTHPSTLTTRNNLAHAREAAETVQQPDTATAATTPNLQRSSGTSD